MNVTKVQYNCSRKCWHRFNGKQNTDMRSKCRNVMRYLLYLHCTILTQSCQWDFFGMESFPNTRIYDLASLWAVWQCIMFKCDYWWGYWLQCCPSVFYIQCQKFPWQLNSHNPQMFVLLRGKRSTFPQPLISLLSLFLYIHWFIEISTSSHFPHTPAFLLRLHSSLNITLFWFG